MKAALVRSFGEIGNLDVVELDDPVPAAGEVIVDVALAEVNFPDVLVVEGRYQNSPKLPFAPGKVAVGHVESVGQGVSSLKVGDRVIAQVEYGAFVEKLGVPEQQCTKIPDGIRLHDAIRLGLPYQTAWIALVERAKMQKGEVVLVLGASGGVGLASIQLAKALGASIVIAATRGLHRSESLLKAGADHVIDVTAVDIREKLREAIQRVSPNQGVDVVIDSVGGDAHAAALRAMNWCGRMVIVGFASNNIPSIKANYLLVKNISVLGIQWSDYRDKQPALVRAAQEHMFELLLQKKLKVQIGQEFTLDSAGSALAAVRDGTFEGRVILALK